MSAAEAMAVDITPPPRRGVALEPLLIPTLFTAALPLGVGMNLGLFFGGIALVTLLLPGLALADSGWRWRTMATGAAVLPAAAVWLLPAFGSLGATMWGLSVALLVAYALAIGGLACALERIGLPPVFAAGITVMAGLLWLAWPIWLAPWVNDMDVVARLVAPHPLLTLNGILREWYPTPWAQHVLAYPLTNLGDDVPYSLPSGIGWAMRVHLAIGGAGVLACGFRRGQNATKSAR